MQKARQRLSKTDIVNAINDGSRLGRRHGNSAARFLRPRGACCMRDGKRECRTLVSSGHAGKMRAAEAQRYADDPLSLSCRRCPHASGKRTRGWCSCAWSAAFTRGWRRFGSLSRMFPSFPPRARGRRSIRREDTPPGLRAPRSTTSGHTSRFAMKRLSGAVSRDKREPGGVWTKSSTMSLGAARIIAPGWELRTARWHCSRNNAPKDMALECRPRGAE